MYALDPLVGNRAAFAGTRASLLETLRILVNIILIIIWLLHVCPKSLQRAGYSDFIAAVSSQ
jgi:hypothetical protein